MSGFGKHKLSDAVPRSKFETSRKKKGKPVSDRAAKAERVREAQESASARNAEASNRDHMIAIGRGNQQAGRQGTS